MQAADRRTDKVEFCFQRSLCPFVETPSSYQTQAGDLSREERVEDEDDWLWTRVEVQLL